MHFSGEKVLECDNRKYENLNICSSINQKKKKKKRNHREMLQVKKNSSLNKTQYFGAVT